MATIAENIQTLRSIKSDIKNAITDKGGSVGNDFKTYAQAITNLPSGGGTENEDALVEGKLSVYYNDRISRVGECAFNSYKSLTSVNLPNCTYIGQSGLAYCSTLTYINLPNCSLIDNYAFAECWSLTYINLPNCLYISIGALQYCSNLKKISLPNCLSIQMYGFNGCTNLTQVYLNSVSSVTKLGFNYVFNNCPNLTSIYVPSSLVNAFKTESNWASLSDKIVAYTGA